jgi:hypothetical protein
LVAHKADSGSRGQPRYNFGNVLDEPAVGEFIIVDLERPWRFNPARAGLYDVLGPLCRVLNDARLAIELTSDGNGIVTGLGVDN